jgi:hypothetical protein
MAFQCGGFCSLANQPRASGFIGSTAKLSFSVRWQVAHSKVRSSKPLFPGEMRASAILCLQVGHIGRWAGILIAWAPITPGNRRGRNSCRRHPREHQRGTYLEPTAPMGLGLAPASSGTPSAARQSQDQQKQNGADECIDNQSNNPHAEVNAKSRQ